MVKLQRYITILSFFGLTAIASTLSIYYYENELTQLKELKQLESTTVTNIFQNFFYNYYEPLLEDDSSLSQVKKNFLINKLNDEILNAVKASHIIRVKIYNTDTYIVFSTDIGQIGYKSPNDHSTRAINNGKLTLFVEREEEKNSTFGTPFNQKHEHVLETYIPITHSETGKITGVFEVYIDITEDLNKTENQAFISITIGITALISLCFFIYIISGNAERKVRYYLEKLNESDEHGRKFSLAIEQTRSSVFITDADGIIEYANPYLCEISGYKNLEILGKTPNIFKSGQNDHKVYDDIYEKINKGICWQGELLNKRKNGSLLWEDIMITPLRDDKGKITNFIAIKDNINDLKLLHEQLLNSQKAIEASHNAICLIDVTDNGMIFSKVNSSFTEITGYLSSEVIGKEFNFLFADNNNPSVLQRYYNAVNQGKKFDFDLDCHKKNGQVFVCDISISPVSEEDNIIKNFVVIMEDISERKRTEAELVKQATYDNLTNLHNRMYLKKALLKSLQTCKAHRTKLALICLDLDHFKLINDNLGHTIGDKVLQKVADRMKLATRDGDILGRQSGDEFIIIAQDIDEATLHSIMNQFLSVFATPFQVGTHQLQVSFSAGISLFPDDAIDFESLYQHADIAMFHTKDEGRNSYHIYRDQMGVELQEKEKIRQGFKTALINNEFELYFQPKVCLKTLSIVGAEALVRWNHPERGIISPAQFIPVAEECGFIVSLGEWVMEAACEAWNTWRIDCHKKITISVNLSSVQFIENTVSQLVKNMIDVSQIPAKYLDLEITESTVISKPEHVIEEINIIKKMGVTISLDDFGTGYSSLAYLKDLPIDTVKIDKSFLQNIDKNSDEEAIVNAIIVMSHQLGCNVVAEGVETFEQLKCLHEKECDQIQGYFFSRPLPSEEFITLLCNKDFSQQYEFMIEHALAS